MYQKHVIKIGGDFGPFFGKKSMGYSTGYFSDFGIFLKIFISRKM